jgi:Raf kinase inhibitor-like YbhB/YbcL family protein
MINPFGRANFTSKSLFEFRSLAKLMLLMGVIPAVLLVQCAGSGPKEGGSHMTIKLTSPAFEEGGTIPSNYTCDGSDVSPPLEWSNVPEGTKSLALICDDPDAPMGTWVHWVLYGIPANAGSLPAGVPMDEIIEGGALQGKNDFKRIGYGGPCPPSGKPHRYFFKLYALDIELDLKSSVKKKDLEKAMKGHVLGQGQLVGRYQR